MNKTELINDCPLISSLEREANRNTARFHMPGHKGENLPFLNSAVDFTEYDGTDNLYCPKGAIEQAQNKAAAAFGSAKTIFCPGGATLALQTCIMYGAYLSRHSKRPIFADRMCHKSVFNAFLLCDIMPVWFLPQQNALIQQINSQKPCMLIITSVDYYGKFRLTKNIIDCCKANNCIIVCDNSHGTHLAFWDDGKKYPIKQGADISVDSAHKTTPALTGGAYINIGIQDKELHQKLLRFMSVFGSTSPSYLIMQSLDWSRAYMSKYAHQKLAEIKDYITDIREFAVKKGFLVNDIQSHDIFRLVIYTQNLEISGKELYAHLYNDGVVCEMWDNACVVLICTVCDTKEMYQRLKNSLENINVKKTKTCDLAEKYTQSIPMSVMSPKDALYSNNCEEIDVEKAVNRISCEIYAPYPPGIPLIMPGEVFTQQIVYSLKPYFEKVRVI